MRKYYFDLVIGIILGVLVALYYLIGPSFAARPIIPYAFVIVSLISLLTSIKTMFFRCMSKGPYVRTIVIAAAIFIAVALFVVGTAVIPAGAFKIFLTLAGAMSFGIAVTTGIRFVFNLR